MKRMLSFLWIPVVVELVNIGIHHALRGPSAGIQLVDLLSIAVTVGVLFFVGWTVARNINRTGLAILAGVVIWMLSALVVGVFTWSEPEALTGFILAAVLSIPVVVAVSWIGALVGKRNRPSSLSA